MTEGGEGRTRALPRPRRQLGDLAQRFALIVVWLGVIALFGALVPQTFLTFANWQTVLGSQAVLVVLSLGLLIPMTAGDYDLSVSGVLTLSAMSVAVLNTQQGWPIWLAVAGALLISTLAGIANGALVVVFGVDPFISTLGSGTVFLGLASWMSNGNTIIGIAPDLAALVVGLKILGIPIAFYYGLALCIVVWLALEYTVFGRRVLFVGRGRSLARLSGISVPRIRWLALISSAFTAGIAGVLYAGTTSSADPTSGSSLLLPAFAAVFLGATSIQPNRFNAWGTLVAVYFLITGIIGLQLMGARSYVQPLFFGGALVVSVALSLWARRREAQDAERLGHG